MVQQSCSPACRKVLPKRLLSGHQVEGTPTLVDSCLFSARAVSCCAAVRATVDDVKEYGTLCDLEGHPDVVGLAAPRQVG